MEDDLQRDGEGYEYAEGPLLPDLRINKEKNSSKENIRIDRRRKGKIVVEGDWGTKGDTKFDLIESGNGVVVLGRKNWHPEDRKSILIIPGINDSTLLELGRLGMLQGKALEIYKKLR
jgi:hypothetical protein